MFVLDVSIEPKQTEKREIGKDDLIVTYFTYFTLLAPCGSVSATLFDT
jgi:hypothetical protein